MLYSDWEQLILVITGPRRFKTTATVVPMVMEAPGAVITTSNRRDVVDLTETPRRMWGPTFVFDPQRLLRSAPQFWVNPLAAITMAERYLWDARAEKLADIFLASSIPAGTRMDAFFDVEGRDLVARLMLAAAVADQPITRVWDWITDPSKEPVELLSATEFGSSAAALERFVGYSDRQKDGLFGTAKRICNVLGRVAIAEWVTPHPRRREFDPREFLAERGTLYPLSKEGVDSASALSTALVWQTLDAAERLGEVHGGRLPVPLVAALDEVANVVNWPDLPAKYSHYGGRGIIVASVLQNWSQGVNCFGEAGMQQLWDAANIRKYGGGVADEEWLGKLSRLIGDQWEQASTTTASRPAGLTASGHGQFSVGRDARKRPILEASQLHQLPRHREIVLWGGRPVMIRPVPYWDRIYGPLIEATKPSTPAKQFRPPPPKSLSGRALMLVRSLLRRDQTSEKAAIAAAVPDTAPGQQGSS
ncbi:type IV secretory system conjugative DNA transfer family protein [Nocardia brasiliensis]|uniref:type IV secretory system conjugative DNA transfer family protein n=1 Tax=Nocardia brasiliensis TaxID=37326 RepID=UPI003D8EAC08